MNPLEELQTVITYCETESGLPFDNSIFDISYDVAKKTVNVFTNIIKNYQWNTIDELIQLLSKCCKHVDELDLVETGVGDIIRRIMKIVRDEHQNQPDELKENIIEAIEQELLNEIELGVKSISRQGVDHVQADEIILTIGESKTIGSFLKNAAMGGKSGKRKFTVIIVSLVPFHNEDQMAKILNKYSIETIVIPMSSVFAIMSRVNKVILGTHTMLANGGLKGPAGAYLVALTAKYFSVPVIVCCPIYKLTPHYLVSHDSEAFKNFSHLHTTVPEPYTGSLDKPTRDDASSIRNNFVQSVHSTFDYVPPELITLFVSNIGGNSPSYVYQLLNELYSKLDYLISDY